MRYHMTVYDSEKYYCTGSGVVSVGYSANSEQEAMNVRDEIRRQYKEKNILFKKSGKGHLVKFGVEHPTHNSPELSQSPVVSLKLDAGTGNSTCIFGSSKRGKSTLMMHLFKKYYNNKDWISILFTNNSHMSLYSDKKLIINDGFDRDSENTIKLEHYINKQTKNEYNFLTMLDDVVDAKYSRIINELVLIYRNANLSSIISLQYAKLLSKQNRTNVNNIFIFGFNLVNEREELINMYLKSELISLGYTTKDQQLEFFDYVTRDHGFFYLKPTDNHISFHRLNLKSHK